MSLDGLSGKWHRYGLAMVFVFRTIPIRYALAIFVTIITVPTFLLLPDQGERPILAVYAGAITMCLAWAAWEHYRRKRRKRRSDANTKDLQS